MHETEQNILAILRRSRSSHVGGAKELREQEIEVWRQLKSQNVKLETIAEWSGITVMVVSRALKNPDSLES